MEVPFGPPDPEWPIRKTRCIPKPPENTDLCTVPKTLEVSGRKRLEGFTITPVHTYLFTWSIKLSTNHDTTFFTSVFLCVRSAMQIFWQYFSQETSYMNCRRTEWKAERRMFKKCTCLKYNCYICHHQVFTKSRGKKIVRTTNRNTWPNDRNFVC